MVQCSVNNSSTRFPKSHPAGRGLERRMGDKVTFRLYLSEQVGEPRKDLEIESSGHGESVNKRCRFTVCQAASSDTRLVKRNS